METKKWLLFKDELQTAVQSSAERADQPPVTLHASSISFAMLVNFPYSIKVSLQLIGF